MNRETRSNILREYRPNVSFLNKEKECNADPELAFYQRQHTFHELLEHMMLAGGRNSYFPMPFNWVKWRNDGLDDIRAITSAFIQIQDISNLFPDAAKKLAIDCERWPFIHSRYIENKSFVHKQEEAVGFTKSKTKATSGGVDLSLFLGNQKGIKFEGGRYVNHMKWPDRITIAALRGPDVKRSISGLANAIVLFHLREIDRYRALPEFARRAFRANYEHFVYAHNTEEKNTKSYQFIPNFWEEWRVMCVDLEPLGKRTLCEWFNVIWHHKIVPEYLYNPAKKPHNPCLSQPDLTILVTKQAEARYKRGSSSKQEYARHLARIEAGEEDEGSMLGDIRQTLYMALKRYAAHRDKHRPNAIPFSW